MRLSSGKLCAIVDPRLVITKRMDEDVQLEGANPSAEEAPEESSEAEMQSGFDFVFSNRLVPRELATKKEIQAYFKGFFKALKTHMQESGESSEKIKEMEGAAVKVGMQIQ
nr:hypothetical protein BaRGS_027273 [Batillaria attramentaria]